MYGRAYGAWLRAGMAAWSRGGEASAGVALRTAKLAAGGPTAAREAKLMVAEKVRAAAELQLTLLGATPLGGTERALRHYRGKVAANRRRLAR